MLESFWKGQMESWQHRNSLTTNICNELCNNCGRTSQVIMRVCYTYKLECQVAFIFLVSFDLFSTHINIKSQKREHSCKSFKSLQQGGPLFECWLLTQ